MKSCGLYLVLVCGFTASALAQPSNDHFAKRTVINENSATFEPIIIYTSNVGATPEPSIDIDGDGVIDKGGEENATAGFAVSMIDSNDGGASIWYEWTPGAALVGVDVTITTAGSDFDTLLGVYSGGVTLATLIEVAENDDDPGQSGTLQSRVTFTIAAATTYYIMVDGFNAGIGNANGTGNVVLQISAVSGAPINDFFSQRIVLTGSQIRTALGDNRLTLVNASLESGEAAYYGGAPTDQWDYSNGDESRTNGAVAPEQVIASVWYSWKPTYAGTVTFSVDTATAGFYEILQGTHITSLTRVTSFPFDVNGTLAVDNESTYHIRVVYTRPNATNIADGYNPVQDFGGGVGVPVPGQYTLGISMANPVAKIVINNPRPNQSLALQTISVQAYFVEEDNNGSLSEPIFDDPTILPFVDRVRFYASYRGSFIADYADADNDVNGQPLYFAIGLDEVAPYSVNWLPKKKGDYLLKAVAEDIEFGYDPVSGSYYPVGSQSTSNTIAPHRITILESFDSGGAPAPNNALTSNTTLINEIYNDVLGRNPTTQEFNNAFALLGGVDDPTLAVPTVTVAELAESIYNTAGSSLKTAQERLIRIYNGFFSRLPTVEEFDVYGPQIASGNLTYEGLGNTLAATTEFINRYGGLSNQGFVEAIYANTGNSLLLVTSYWTGLLTSGETRGLVGIKLIEPELYNIDAVHYDLGYEATAAIIMTLFNRQPTAEELAGGNDVSTALASYYSSGSYTTRYISDPNPTIEKVGTLTVVVDKVENVFYLLNEDGQLDQAPQPTVQYKNWKSTYGGGAALDNPLGDGGDDAITNITEYAFEALGFDPTVADGGLLPATQMVGSTFLLDYVVDVIKTDANVILEYSDDGMVTFKTIDPNNPPNGFTVENTGFIGLTVLNKRVSVDTSICPSCFFKVTVTSNVEGTPSK